MNIKKICIFLSFSIPLLFLSITKDTFSATATLYFNNATSTSWDDLENWWTDASFSAPASSIPVNGNTVYLGGTTTAPSITVTLAHIYVAASSTGGGSFRVGLGGMGPGQAVGDATFYDYSHNDNDTISGNAIFYDHSHNEGGITGNATFYDSSYNGGGPGGHVYGSSATFYDSSYNSGYIEAANAYFHDNSSSNNYIFHHATFYDTTTNGSFVQEDAFFSCSATNNGTVVGSTTYDGVCATIVSASFASDNSYIDITVSEPIWGDNSSTTVLTSGKFSLTFNQNGGNATGATISSLTKTTGGFLDGSETVIRFNLTITGIPNGVETIAIKPLNGTSIYNAAAYPMRSEQTTGSQTLHNQTPHSGRRNIYYLTTTTAPISSSEDNSTSTIVNSTTTQIITETIPSFPIAVSPAYQFSFTQILKIGSVGDEVKKLQVFLSTHKFPVSQIGAGSLGHETTYFGKKTKEALIKFQESNAKDILLPQNLTKGTGIFWIYSKKFINQILLEGN